MLSELSVENFALVEGLRLSFGPGLNLLTGETGAGKSILLDALGMALGERTSGDSVRHGADKARVEAVFTLDTGDARLAEMLQTMGIEVDDTLLLARELTAAGKSSVRINGRPATVGMLKTIGDTLVDIHGQHEHQSLLAVERHADILDAWCGADIATLKAEVAESAQAAQSAAKELAALQQDARERARTLDLLAFQRDEIDTAAPKPEEEEVLLTERLRLSSAERLHSAASGAYTALYGGASEGGKRGRGAMMAAQEGGGALDGLTTAVAEIDSAAKLDDRLSPLLESLQNALYAAEDAAREVRDYRDSIEFNPQRLEEIENRLDVLKTLKRKYGDTLEEVVRYRAEIGDRLETLENAEERIALLQARVEETRAELIVRAGRLTEARKAAAEPFAHAIMKELADLAMTATRFAVSIEPREPSARGADHVEFLLSPNPGVPLKPLAKIASGGEISRVMLAMKSVLSRIAYVPTLIFDEIDTGIGGRTGTVLADKLYALARNAQVLCITHLAQIAAKGDRHFFIEKKAEDGKTTISVAALDEPARVQEIARMLGGSNDTESAVQYARQMLGATPVK